MGNNQELISLFVELISIGADGNPGINYKTQAYTSDWSKEAKMCFANQHDLVKLFKQAIQEDANGVKYLNLNLVP